MTTAITVPNPLPQLVVALTPEAVQQASEALASVQQIVADGVTADTFAEASAAYERAKKIAKAIEAGRQDVKRPVLDLGKAIDAAAKAAIVPLDNATAELGRLIAAEQRRQAEERERAIAEQRRIEAERCAKQAEIDRANAKAAEAGADLDWLGSAPEVAAPTHIAIPEKHKTVVRMVKRYSVRAVDPSLVPRTATDADGNMHTLLVVDEAAVLRALKAGAIVPGYELVTTEEPAALGR